jgi:hypothetical protein
MTVLEDERAETAATAAARRNWEANLAALQGIQPWVVEALGRWELDESHAWMFGRDGFLTVVDGAGRWHGGCSLPKRAGVAMLKRLELRGVVGCLLAPTHGGQVMAALEKLERRQAVVVVLPEVKELGVLLRCCDFSEDVAAHRLWVAAGADWAGMVNRIFEEQPGLPTPTQFIRTVATAEEVVQGLVPRAEECFNRVNEGRVRRMREGRDRAAGDSPALNRQILVVAPTHFRLWDDGGFALSRALDGSVVHLDPDDPAQASGAGLALAAAAAAAVVTINKGRGDLPGVLAKGTPVVTWVAHPCIPAHEAASPRDGLLLGDESWVDLARWAGWPEDRVKVVAWPEVAAASRPASPAVLALIANTATLETPVTELDLSSHHVLWESIRQEIGSDPFCVGSDVEAFLARRREALHIGTEGFDRGMFIERLIVPAWQRAVARMLLDAGLPLRVYGSGWDELPGLREHWEGPVRTREQFLAAAGAATALVYPWPMRYRGAIDALRRGVVWAGSRDPREWVRRARAALKETPVGRPGGDSLADGVAALLG